MLKRLLRGEKLWVLADQLVVSGCAFLTQFIIARSLGLEVYGYFSAIVLVQLFLLSLQQSALTGIYQVMYAGVPAGRRGKYTGGLWSQQALFVLAVLLAGGLFCILYPLQMSTGVKAAALLNVVLLLLQDFWRKVLLTQGRGIKAFIIDVVNNGLQLAGLAALVWYQAFDFSACLWVCALSYAPAAVLGHIWGRPGRATLGRAAFVYRLQSAQSGWMLLSALLQWFAGNFYIIAAGWWLGPVALGALRLGQYLFGLLNILMAAVENYVLPRVGQAPGSEEGTIRYLRMLLVRLMTVILPLLAVIVCAHKPLLLLIGKGEPAYAGIIYGLALVYVFVTVGYPVRFALRAFQLNRAYFTGYMINALFSFCTAYFFIHQWGLNGVLAGLFASQVILISYWLMILQKRQSVLWKSFTSY